MMLYAIIGEDVPDSLEKRLAMRPAHLGRLQALQAEGACSWLARFPRSTAPTRVQKGSAVA